MKPIIIVIVSGAMLMLAMLQDTNNKSNELSQGSRKHELHVKVPEEKQDSEMLMHNVSLWLDRLQ